MTNMNAATRIVIPYDKDDSNSEEIYYIYYAFVA